MDNKERDNCSSTTPRTHSFSKYETTPLPQDNSQFSETGKTNHSNEFNSDLIVGRYLIYDSRTKRCYARNNSSIEINTPRNGNHISKMVDAILGCASPNSVKEVICHSSLSRSRIPLPEPSLVPPPPPPYPPSAISAVSRIMSPPPPHNSPPLVSMSPFLPESPLTPRQLIQNTPKSTPRQNQLADSDSPPYSPFSDSHFAQFDIPSPPVSDYLDGSELSYSSIFVHNSPTTPRNNISEINSPSIKYYPQHSSNLNERYDHLSNTPSRKVHVTNLLYNGLSPSPNDRINSNLPLNQSKKSASTNPKDCNHLIKF
ncbi:hypothetical protein C1645_784973 [Glomus cerebriforme]|uniref:Uncharacterized protein n=1 Tax=Glomus cerebriforme TaxID=658196 RepID=A0A397SCQ7_9GLOM|nr:hypothetical protein C1645_784973 [Glomus cerebriforme]